MTIESSNNQSTTVGAELKNSDSGGEYKVVLCMVAKASGTKTVNTGLTSISIICTLLLWVSKYAL